MKRSYEQETALIKELEAKKCPPLIPSTRENNWQPDNAAYWQFITEIQDAYWRRRQLSAKPGECAPG